MENISRCACVETDDKELLNRIAELAMGYEGEGSLIQVLHMAQGVYGHLPIEVQQVVADAMGLPPAEVSGVVSFYSFFAIQPRGKPPFPFESGLFGKPTIINNNVETLANIAPIIFSGADWYRSFGTEKVMGCPGGCINRGGQPRTTKENYRQLRGAALYREDEGKPLRKSHENPDLAELYNNYLGQAQAGICPTSCSTPTMFPVDCTINRFASQYNA